MKDAYRYSTLAGNAIFTRVSSRRPRQPGEKRKPRMNPTVEQVKKLNERYAIRDLCIKINHNFQAGDMHIVLTYANAVTPDEAKKLLKQFIRRLTKEYRKRAIILKWIYVTEWKHQRIHHHMIISAGMSLGDLERVWSLGAIRARALNRYGHYWQLGEYLVKETKKTFADPGNPFRKRYSCSRTVVNPPTIREEVSAMMLEEPHVIKGYYLDQDSVRVYECPITGRKCLEYIQLALNNPLTRYKRGRKARDATPTGASWLAQNRENQLSLSMSE